MIHRPIEQARREDSSEEVIVVDVLSSSRESNPEDTVPSEREAVCVTDSLGERKHPHDRFTSLNTTDGGLSGYPTLGSGRDRATHSPSKETHSLMSSFLGAPRDVPSPRHVYRMLPDEEGRHSINRIDGAFQDEMSLRRLLGEDKRFLVSSSHGESTHPWHASVHFTQDSWAEDSPEADDALYRVHAPSSDLAMELVADVTYKSSLRTRVWEQWSQRQDARATHRRHQEYLAAEYYHRNSIYLFFRAWQWRFSQRALRKEGTEKAAEIARRHRLQRTLRNWQTFVKKRRHQQSLAEQLEGESRKVFLSRACTRWQHWCGRKELANALCAVSQQTLQSNRLQQWAHFTLSKKRQQLCLDVMRLHLPSAWGGESLKGTEDGTAELLVRKSLLQWMRVTCTRRARRLELYAVYIQQLQASREQHLRERVWRRWLLCTLSTAQSRRCENDLRMYYYRKWFTFSQQAALADREKALREGDMLSRIIQHWKVKANDQARAREQAGKAAAFLVSHRQHHLVASSWGHWKERCTHRARARLLEGAGVKARQELLQHLAVQRLVENVLSRVNVMESTDSQPAAATVPLLRKNLTAPLPLRRDHGATPLEAAQRAMNPLPKSALSAPAPPFSASPVTVERGTSPLRLPQRSPPVDAHTQTMCENTLKTRRKQVKPRSSGRLALFMKSCEGPSLTTSSLVPGPSASRDLLSQSWRHLSIEELKLRGNALVKAYRTFKLAAPLEQEEDLMLSLEAEQLATFLQTRTKEGEADIDDHSSVSTDSEDPEVREARNRLEAIRMRQQFLSLREDQRKRLRSQVEQLATEIEWRRNGGVKVG